MRHIHGAPLLIALHPHAITHTPPHPPPGTRGSTFSSLFRFFRIFWNASTLTPTNSVSCSSLRFSASSMLLTCVVTLEPAHVHGCGRVC